VKQASRSPKNHGSAGVEATQTSPSVAVLEAAAAKRDEEILMAFVTWLGSDERFCRQPVGEVPVRSVWEFLANWRVSHRTVQALRGSCQNGTRRSV
jgi:hypothetical protein